MKFYSINLVDKKNHIIIGTLFTDFLFEDSNDNMVKIDAAL